LRGSYFSRAVVHPRIAIPFKRLYNVVYGHRRWVAGALYAGVTVVAYAAGYLFRFEFRVPTTHWILFLQTLPILLVIRVATNTSFRLSSERWRFISTGDVLRLVSATAVGTGVFYLVTRVLPFGYVVPRSVILIEWTLTTYVTCGIWILYRTVYEVARRHTNGNGKGRRNAIIVGAGEAGNLLARELTRSPSGVRVLGFVDDDALKWGSTLQGYEVIGSTEDLPEISSLLRADEIIVAIPSVEPHELRRILNRCEATGLQFRILPGIVDVMEGHVRLSQLREVRVEDLLGRDPVKLELPELAEDLGGKTVMITGAAGSIGSELTRQIALHGPGRLVLLDQAETPLYYLELELKNRFPDVEAEIVVGDVVDPYVVERACRLNRPDRVFHAAAYKHVPMMETNLRAAVRNNVLGTWRMADASARWGAEKFVLVSTDKAVRPASIMGATKRLAELAVLNIQCRYPDTSFTAVRFGNVLGSAGSVIPLFKKQLEEGKALTVTHAEASRYFMTIPEAVQLILQASLIDEVRGHIAMLDMGQPVRILEMARNLIRLSGKEVDDDSIVFIGLRPGEKLHEELRAPDEETIPTRIQQISVIAAAPSSRELDGDALASLIGALDGGVDSEEELRYLVHGSFDFIELPSDTEGSLTGAEAV